MDAPITVNLHARNDIVGDLLRQRERIQQLEDALELIEATTTDEETRNIARAVLPPVA